MAGGTEYTDGLCVLCPNVCEPPSALVQKLPARSACVLVSLASQGTGTGLGITSLRSGWDCMHACMSVVHKMWYFGGGAF
ncbi:hypothetical protein TESG_08632 [Trichophyton tonsurans CBS 112818]|uniref:Uncharacterized protein n=1 Tax=Trichophyton tonsurans (strain CBS 112818) TaxID=647933 RepID=F2S992_TRIT1|nr:hypothetical protein TESG_08632 [Trichophyton tonsurans CBS 112818]